MFSADGWNVNFGGTQTNALDKTGGQNGASLPGLSGASGGGNLLLYVALAIVAGAVLWKLRK